MTEASWQCQALRGSVTLPLSYVVVLQSLVTYADDASEPRDHCFHISHLFHFMTLSTLCGLVY